MKTISETLMDLRREGVVIDLHIDDANRLRVGSQSTTYEPKEVRMIWTRRFEGQSNPDDLAILYGLQLPDGRVGVLVDGYGPSSDPDITTFIRAVPRKTPEQPDPESAPHPE
ncbi:MAG: hypothetical protein H6568_11510 [Lewinellaceae bacterium]|nr:hypothetical protein [Saprospiraceae bacterium]MCB9313379.1 hypothetical protein [Lewinellaceae bacterium]HRW74908.1 hypothetical protein [Saprospiraceae bacterium]